MPPPPADEAPEGALEADEDLLRRWALPVDEGAKASRGTCLVVGGSALTPGAVVLAAVGALRSGVGKVQVATAAGAAPALAVAVPEALVVGLDEDEDGTIVPESVDELMGSVDGATSVLVGPGCLAPGPAHRLLARIAGGLDDGVLVVDAKALHGLADDPGLLGRLRGRSIITPNAGELAALAKRDEVDDDEIERLAVELAGRLDAVVAAKGADTAVATSDGRLWRVRGGGSGLSTAGSGDVLAGIVGGLAARADEPAQAAVHAVHVHAEAGRRLAARVGRLGFLARELLDEVPRILDDLAP